MADKRQASTIKQRDLEPKLEIIRTKTRELQEQVRQQSFHFQWNLLCCVGGQAKHEVCYQFGNKKPYTS